MRQLNPFLDELPIPDIVHATPGIPSSHYLALAARPEKVKIHRDLPATDVWCYRMEHGQVARRGSGTTFLGPTVEVQRRQTVTVAWKNEIAPAHKLPFEVIKVPNSNKKPVLPVPENVPGRDGALTDQPGQDPGRAKLRALDAALVTHLHGARVQADYDGWPDNTAVSGQAAHYTYPNDQAATLLWYHDHSMHVTRLNVFAGLAGLWLVRDAEEGRLHLPSGAQELPLVIQDRNLDLDAQGNFSGAFLHKTEVKDGPAEFFGPYTLVNGMIWPKVTVEPRLYRLRVLNAANARTYRLILLDETGQSVNGKIWQIGSDQGLMREKAPVPDEGLVLAPSERVDLLADFSGYHGKSLFLWNTADAPFGDDPANRPDAAAVKAQLLALLTDPLATTDLTDPANRLPFPQVMRFDVAGAATGPSSAVPADPLWQGDHDVPAVVKETPVRVMGLVEIPADDAAGPDATSTLVFYEFVPVDEEPAPCGALVVKFTYWHPGQGAAVTRDYWKAAEGFYDRVNWRAHLGETELWYIVNLSPDTHPIHVHLVHFFVNQRSGFEWDGTGVSDKDGPIVFDPTRHVLNFVTATSPADIGAGMTSPKDTVRVNPGEMVGIVMTFSPYPGRFIYHCHILEHEDHDMMRPYVVVPRFVPHHEH